MLRELKIKNLAIIDDLTIRFEKGFNVLSGETGAGKSIIVDSLKLLLGSRANAELVRTGEKEAIIQALFELDDVRLTDIGIEQSDGLIIRRVISSTGKSKSYINDIIVSVQTLNEIGKRLVDIHGQHEHQSLFSIEKHKDLLDSFGKLLDKRKYVETQFRELETLFNKELELSEKIKERYQRIDLLRFQINEIDSSSLKIGEKEELLKELKILSNINKLKELSELIYSILYSSEDSCIERLSFIINKLKEMSSIDNSMEEILKMVESAKPLLEEVAIILRDYRLKHDLQPAKIEEIEERLETIKKLERKYGEGIENILKYRKQAETELNNLEMIDEELDLVKEKIIKTKSSLFEKAEELSKERKKIAKELEKLVKNELKELAFNKSEFIVDIQKSDISYSGFDKIEFMFSANPGELPKPLVKIVSGGELSRIMLALKSILTEIDTIPVLVFDEVDAGIGGKTAISVGKKLKELSKFHQVLCTTHLPQIAAMADFHIKIEKEQSENKTYVKVIELTLQDRIYEIARMLGGKITELSLEHAKELLYSNNKNLTGQI